MVKQIMLILLLITSMWGKNVYERNCIPCHQTLSSTLQQMFKGYLQTYSGEQNVKAGLKHYLRFPHKSISVMSDLFIDTYGIKKKTTLNNEELDEAINIYWEKFKVFDKLK